MKTNVLVGASLLCLGLAGTAYGAFIDFRLSPFNTCTPGNSCTRTVGGVQVTVEGWTDVNNDNALDPLVDTPAPLWWDNIDGFGVQSNVGYEPDEIDGPEFLIVRFGTTQTISSMFFTDLFYEGNPQYQEIGYYRLTVGGVTGSLVQFLADTSQVPGSTNGEKTLTLANEYADNITYTAPGVQGSQGHEFSVGGVNATSASANLSISKADSPDPLPLGQNLTYTITVTNAGPNSAHNVIVSDPLPAGVTFVSATTSQGSCSGTTTVTCTIGTLANSANATVTIVVTPTGTGTLNNTATVSSTTSDPNTSNNSSTATTTVNPSADLSIAKADSPDPVFVGENLTYTITVSNAGPSQATGVTVTDTLPAGATYVSASPSQGTCSGTSAVMCNLGNLANGASATVTIVVTPTTDGTLSNSASVTSTTGDPVGGNNTSTAGTTVNPSADLSITKTDGPDPVVVGQNLTYSITVTNNGPSQATGVTVTDTLPGSVTFVSASPSQGSCTPSSGTVTCSLGNLANGANATITIVVTPTATGTISNSASVSSGTHDPNTGNNSAGPVNTTVNGSADLSITKTDSPDPVLVGQNLTYTITVTNNGPTSASNVSVTDTLPAGVTYVSATPSQGTCSGTSTVTCNLGTVAYPGSATVTIMVTPTSAGSLSNSACVSSSTNDPNPGNNCTGPVITTVNAPSADLSITKSDSPDPVVVGQNLTYTITVTNSGPNAAANVAVTDALPGGVTFISATPSQGTCSGTSTVTCNLGNLAFPGSATVTIVVTPTTAGTLNNSVSVSSTTNDPNTGNNSTGPVTTVVNPATPASADLAITKVDTPDPVAVGLDVTYTITVSNGGPDSATGVVVTDTLPTAVTVVSSASSQGTCGTPSGGSLTCSLGSLGNGASATVMVVVRTTTAGVIVNTASVTSDVSDPNLANNSATANTNVGDISRLINISTRLPVQTGDKVLIGGFIVGGNTPKTLLIRARGPSLSGAPFNIGGVLANPFLQLFSGATLIAQNDNWQVLDPLCGAPITACYGPTEITATGMHPCVPNPGQTVVPPNCVAESALLVTLPPGPYTAIVSGVGGGMGVGLVEVFDPDTSTLPKLTNISSRGMVQTIDNVMIGGYIVGAGGGNKTVLIRARGPSMAGAPFNLTGVLANPSITLHSGLTVIAQNNDWQTTDPLCAAPISACGNATQIAATGMDPCQPNPGQTVPPPNCANEAALLVTLPPGPYTVIVRGVSNTTGVGLVEIFELSADLAITKVDSPDPVAVGNPLTYTLTVTNNGPNLATGVMVLDPLPAGVTLVSATPSQGTCTPAGTVTCNVGSLANGASATVSIVVTPTVPGSLTNTASVTGDLSDPETSNNTTPAVPTTVTP